MENQDREYIIKFPTPEPPKRGAPLDVVGPTIAGILSLAVLFSFGKIRDFFSGPENHQPATRATENPDGAKHDANRLKSQLDKNRRAAQEERER